MAESGEEIGENSNDRGGRGGFKDDQPREASEDDIEIEAPPPVQFTAGNGRRNFDEPDPTESRRESIILSPDLFFIVNAL